MTVHPFARHADAVVELELTNDHSKRVRVEDIRIVILDGDRTLRTDAPGKAFFDDAVFPRDRRIETTLTVAWRGVCLPDLPGKADRVRFDLDLSTRNGVRRQRRVQSHTVGLAPATAPVRLRLPFDGYWKVTQGHGCSTHHRTGGLGGEFAWDFAAIGETTGRVDGRLDQERTFGAPILSPSNGLVVRVVEGVPDNIGLTDYPRRSMLDDLRRPEWIFGNFVVIELGKGAWVLLAHLQQDSITVVEGQEVSAGQPIARGGNSGNTIEAHLHVQVMNGADPADPATSGIPAVFVDYTEFTTVAGGTDKDIQARSVAVGDPTEQSVVAPR
ncbi:MAG: M23 family metallopeptidase [Acidobacteriota bacterium]|nr:M23 family metallopeptidase [Acidobacteriota bacterium]